ncbi:hypothetical protein [Sporosarcina limicola]|uniref:Uncharacterized protein n=1 Tax=Sporosarcina limicola TaxID=34101 RepID=A0A927R3W0_9BACL|nr:hypothetical protein [Sporosarcina limicola]MBE1555511.1 hypothetical protein [Sporosarcina limicola]
MEEMLKKEYGLYAIPEEVGMLIRLEEELNKEGESLDTIGFMPIVHEFAYAITPPDLIPFAHTGGGGIHFGFLTDFDQITDLHEAPIVCVSPTNDPPIRYLARNIQEFLSLASSVPHVEMLESFWPCENEGSMEAIQKDFLSNTDVEWNKKREMIARRFHKTFSTGALPVQQYVQEVLKERHEKMIIPTFDGLGIIGSADSVRKGQRFKLDDQHRQTEQELTRMRDFLASATREEKLAFIRDAYYWYILTPDYDGEVLKVVVELLKTLDLPTVVDRLEFRTGL